MKTRILFSVSISIIFLFFIQNSSIAQLQITTGVDPNEMLENLLGPGILAFDNVTYQGADVARGIFSNGDSTNLGMEAGIFLCSGSGDIIPGPNNQSSAGVNNGLGGHPILGAYTYDAAVLEFDFIPMNDTLRCKYVFGSEEYNEWVFSAFNDVFGFFITGPKPDSSYYMNYNIALVPSTCNTPVAINNVNNGWAAPGVVPTGPCTHCEYFSDNTGGLTLEYDGKTTVLIAWVKVIPYENYHILLAIADAGDHIYDSGILLEESSFYSSGPPELLSFNFLMENNPGLSFDIIGVLTDSTVHLEVPEGTDISNLIANFEEEGAYVTINGITQVSGITQNDYTEPVIYHLQGSGAKDWTVFVEIVTDIPENVFKEVVISPNPSDGVFKIENIQEINVSIYSAFGKVVKIYYSPQKKNSLLINNLPERIYFIQLEKNGQTETRKVVVL